MLQQIQKRQKIIPVYRLLVHYLFRSIFGLVFADKCRRLSMLTIMSTRLLQILKYLISQII